jgi:hypothetical protein
MENKIQLGELLRFKSLRERFTDKRIKLRFNKNWYWKDDTGEGWFDYVQEYRDSRGECETAFYMSLYSSYSEKRKRLQTNDIVFQFIEIGWRSWLLVDVRVIIDADGCKHKNNWTYAQAETVSEYEPYFGRVLVEWVNKGQVWYYTNPDIVDTIPVDSVLAKTFLERTETFGGYEEVCKTYTELKRIINHPEWWAALSNIYGVYVITDRATGKQYVGSAYGENGVAGRWSVYLHSGYDKDEKETGEYPNLKLTALVKEKGLKYVQKNFQYALLEFYPKNEAGRKKALSRETYWKEVLQTRGEFGYNSN